LNGLRKTPGRNDIVSKTASRLRVCRWENGGGGGNKGAQTGRKKNHRNCQSHFQGRSGGRPKSLKLPKRELERKMRGGRPAEGKELRNQRKQKVYQSPTEKKTLVHARATA